MADAESPTVRLPDTYSQLIGKDPDAGKDSRQEENGQQKIRWLDGITKSMDMGLSKLGDDEEQGSLVCCSPWGCRVIYD